MESKIQWYREILDSEPNSRVFFSLSRLLAEGGRAGEALDVLRRGLDHNPEHEDARRLLVEVLQALAEDDRQREEVCRSGIKEADSPAIWKAWAAFFAGRQHADDFSAALQLLNEQLDVGSISLSEVLERGLYSLLPAATDKEPELHEKSSQEYTVDFEKEDMEDDYEIRPERKAYLEKVRAVAEKALNPEDRPEPLDSYIHVNPEAYEPKAAQEDFSTEDDEDDLPNQVSTKIRKEEADSVSLLQEVAWQKDDGAAAEEEDLVPDFKTKTMAGLLAQQGDVKGALSILKGLRKKEKDPAAAADLDKRIHELEQRNTRYGTEGMDRVVRSIQEVGCEVRDRASREFDAFDHKQAAAKRPQAPPPEKESPGVEISSAPAKSEAVVEPAPEKRKQRLEQEDVSYRERKSEKRLMLRTLEHLVNRLDSRSERKSEPEPEPNSSASTHEKHSVKHGTSVTGKAKLLDILETLASRLEKRVGSSFDSDFLKKIDEFQNELVGYGVQFTDSSSAESKATRFRTDEDSERTRLVSILEALAQRLGDRTSDSTVDHR